jgi:hypothetical protein
MSPKSQLYLLNSKFSLTIEIREGCCERVDKDVNILLDCCNFSKILVNYRCHKNA